MDKYKEMLIESISQLEKLIDANEIAWCNQNVGTSLWTLTDLRAYKKTKKILSKLLDERNSIREQ